VRDNKREKRDVGVGLTGAAGAYFGEAKVSGAQKRDEGVGLRGRRERVSRRTIWRETL